MASPLLHAGARASPLSLAQTRWALALLARRLGIADTALEITPLTTSGDRLREGPLTEAGGKGLFTKELDEALLDRRVDFAVHSMKDLPARLPAGIILAATPQREDPRDAFISARADTLGALAPGAIVGTASLRRQAQTLFARNDLTVQIMRGNIDTRLAKLARGEADATYLALAGLKRLGLDARASSIVDPREAPPAPGQGALAITAREGDRNTLDALRSIHDHAAHIETTAERAFLAALDGSCRTAIGALARLEGTRLSFIGEALSPDGAQRWRRESTIDLAHDAAGAAERLGAALGAEVRAEAGEAFRPPLA